MSHQEHPDYPKLDECLKATFSPRDYATMTDEERRTLEQDVTSPECEDNP